MSSPNYIPPFQFGKYSVEVWGHRSAGGDGTLEMVWSIRVDDAWIGSFSTPTDLTQRRSQRESSTGSRGTFRNNTQGFFRTQANRRATIRHRSQAQPSRQPSGAVHEAGHPPRAGGYRSPRHVSYRQRINAAPSPLTVTGAGLFRPTPPLPTRLSGGIFCQRVTGRSLSISTSRARISQTAPDRTSPRTP
jgi:hypothetical protein